jgi:hypothetical protein
LLQIKQDGSIAITLSPSKVIHTHDWNRSRNRARFPYKLESAEQRIVADRQAHAPAETLTGPATQSIGKQLGYFTEAVGLLRALAGHAGKALAEDLSLTARVAAAPASNSYFYFDRDSLHGKIPQMSEVTAVSHPGHDTAVGACRVIRASGFYQPT